MMNIPNKEQKRILLRLCADLNDEVAASARQNSRSMNSELNYLVAVGLATQASANRPENAEYDLLLSRTLEALDVEQKTAVLKMILALVAR